MTADPGSGAGAAAATLAGDALPRPLPSGGGRVGLVLAGGGEVGIAWHAAVIEAIAAWSGWNPDDAEVVVGTSAGSWLAALLRAGVDPAHLVPLAIDERIPDPQETVALLGDPVVVPRAARPRPWPPSSPRLVGRALRRGSGIRLASALTGLMPSGTLALSAFGAGLDRVYGERWPARPLWLTAVDLESGRRVVFGRDAAPTARVSEAVAASCSVPAYFAPTLIAGRRYVDGGIHSVANLDLVAGLDLDLVIVSSPISAALPRRGHGADGRSRRYLHRRLMREVELVREGGTPVAVVAPMPEDLEVMGSVMQALERDRRVPVARAARRTLRHRLDHGLLGRELVALTPVRRRA